MFDYYEPVPELSCPECGTALRDWQGKGGPCALFVWKQGVATPIDQRADEDAKLPMEHRNQFQLTGDCAIASWDCPMHAPVGATCVVEDGVWTKVVDLEFSRSRRA